MTIVQKVIAEGGKYFTEANSIGHIQVKEVLRIIPDQHDSLRDVIEYRAKVYGSNIPWVMHRCTRKIFVNNIASTEAKLAS